MNATDNRTYQDMLAELEVNGSVKICGSYYTQLHTPGTPEKPKIYVSHTWTDCDGNELGKEYDCKDLREAQAWAWELQNDENSVTVWEDHGAFERILR